MSRQGRVLIVDDTPQWCKELEKTLLHSGFYVDTVASALEALEKLDEELYHLLILDLCLNENEIGNEDGMSLLHTLETRKLSKAIKVIVLSSHVTKESIRAAFRDYKVVDFLAKDEYNSHDFLKNVQSTFTKHLNINLMLDIHWQQISSPEQVVLNLALDGIFLKSDSPLLKRIASELEDLLCRLFSQAKGILVRPLPQNWSDAGTLLIQPFYTTGSGQAVVIKFGSVHKIEEEYRNFKEYVQPFVGGGRNTTILNVDRTPLLGGIMYSMLSAGDDRWEDFGEFYQHAEISQIKETLNRLFLDTCGAWYASPGLLQMHDLTSDYKQLFDWTLEHISFLVADQLKHVQGTQRLYFHSLGNERAFTNPMLASTGQSFVLPTYICTTHGDFNQHNILVDSTMHAWLVDFQATGRGHILRDISKLDSVVRFQLLVQATLEERLAMESTLCDIEHFSQVEQLATSFTTDNIALEKAYATVVHLRSLAQKMVAQNRSDNISEYYVALLYNAFNTLSFSELSMVQREHALLCASLLVDQLGLGGQDSIVRDLRQLQAAIGDRSYRNYEKLSEIIIRRMGATQWTLIKPWDFKHSIAWEILLPETGLRLTTQRAILLLRQQKVPDQGYRDLNKQAQDNALIIIIDIADVPHSPFQSSPYTIWFSPSSLLEMIETSYDQLPGWLGRFIMTRLEKNVKQVLLPYATEGAAKLFVGREYELTRLTRLDRLGGVITGAHQSGKSSLLQELKKHLSGDNLNVIGPLGIGGIGFQTFFEITLKNLNITLMKAITSESWTSMLRSYKNTGIKPIFLLDEVDDLLKLDAQNGFSLGRQMRSLHYEGYCTFFMAGHNVLREATYHQYGPFRNFANEIILTGVTEEACKLLIQRPMQRLGFSMSDEQVKRIFRGTAGVPFLVQDLCIRLLCGLPSSQINRPEIADSAITEVEQSYGYLETVFNHYIYAQEWDGQCVMLCTALYKEVSRQDIMQEFTKYGVSLARPRLDELLLFLVDFGVLKPLTANLYTLLPEYLYQALLAREPEPLLYSLLIKGKQER